MPSAHWMETTAIKAIVLAVPSAALLGRIYWLRSHVNGRMPKQHVAFWTTLAVLILFLLSVVNIFFQWSVPFMVAWPLLGIALTFLGLGLAFLAPVGDRSKLAIANVLLLILTLALIVAPN